MDGAGLQRSTGTGERSGCDGRTTAGRSGLVPAWPDKRGAALYIKETNPEVAMLNEPVSGRPLTRSRDRGAA